jgi:hypothetical protein
MIVWITIWFSPPISNQIEILTLTIRNSSFVAVGTWIWIGRECGNQQKIELNHVLSFDMSCRIFHLPNSFPIGMSMCFRAFQWTFVLIEGDSIGEEFHERMMGFDKVNKLIENARLNWIYPSIAETETWKCGKFEIKSWKDIWLQRNIPWFDEIEVKSALLTRKTFGNPKQYLLDSTIFHELPECTRCNVNRYF